MQSEEYRRAASSGPSPEDSNACRINDFCRPWTQRDNMILKPNDAPLTGRTRTAHIHRIDTDMLKMYCDIGRGNVSYIDKITTDIFTRMFCDEALVIFTPRLQQYLKIYDYFHEPSGRSRASTTAGCVW